MASSHRDYVPQNAAQYFQFMSNLINYVQKMAAQWTNIPAVRINELIVVFNLFAAAFETSQETPTPANLERRREAQAESVRVLRQFVNQFLRFPPVTNADRIEMGIPNHDTIRTDHKVVTEIVDFVIHLSSIRELVVDFWIQGADHKAKPEGYDGAVIIWGLRDTPPKPPISWNATQWRAAPPSPFILRKPSAAVQYLLLFVGKMNAALPAHGRSISPPSFRKE
jgi:hypothetical protein